MTNRLKRCAIGFRLIASVPLVGCALLAAFLCSNLSLAEEAASPSSTVSSSSTGDNNLQTIRYHGIRPTDPMGQQGLRNPERGLRIETLIAEPEGGAAWGPAHHLRGTVSTGYSDQWWILDAQRYEQHGLTLAQTYCYLDDFIGKPLSAEKLRLLRGSLDQLRQHGLKAVLRFAYEKDMDRQQGPTLDDILRHLDQLAPILQANADVLFVVQAGFVGAWGEWHSSTHALEQDHGALARIVAKLLEVLPPQRMTQVRVPKYKRWVLNEPVLGGFEQVTDETAYSSKPAARIGFNNDGFLAGTTCGGTWTEPPHFSNPGNPEFDYMTEESAYVPVDGELFWSDQGGKIDGLRAAVRLRLHHYASFSLAHSFSEREGKPYSIDAWMQTPLTVADVRQAMMPVAEGYFEDNAGQQVSRTQFEYIRDHLGYRLELQQAEFPQTAKLGDALSVQLELINRGFSTLYNPRSAYLVLIDDDQRVTIIEKTTADPRRWQPFAPGDPQYRSIAHTIVGSVPTSGPLEPGRYALGLWLPDASESLHLDSHYAVRLANRDVSWWTDPEGRYGINLLGHVELVR